MNISELIKETLISMKKDAAALKSNPSELDLKSIISKYDTIFTGEKFNKVLSIEVAALLNIENKTFNKHIGQITHELHMGLEGLHQLDSDDPNSVDAYYITLY